LLPLGSLLWRQKSHSSPWLRTTVLENPGHGASEGNRSGGIWHLRVCLPALISSFHGCSITRFCALTAVIIYHPQREILFCHISPSSFSPHPSIHPVPLVHLRSTCAYDRQTRPIQRCGLDMYHGYMCVAFLPLPRRPRLTPLRDSRRRCWRSSRIHSKKRRTGKRKRVECERG
jgi:hypothetical protein